MPRKNRRDDDHTRVRTRKSRSEHAYVGVLSYHEPYREQNNEQAADREPAAAA
jgi:hypothetical protein